MMRARDVDVLELSDEELAFFRLTLDLFPTPESPLRSFEDRDVVPEHADKTFESLQGRSLLNAAGVGASDAVRDRLLPVAECNARVRVTVRAPTEKRVRDFYVSGNAAVEYGASDASHHFGPSRSESALAGELAHQFRTAPEGVSRSLRMSSGDYLVFAVFARDLRGAREDTPVDAMSIDEVLAYFDEPEHKTARLPDDEAWQASVTSLAKQRVLVEKNGNYELHSSLHALAREIVADHQHNIVRFDYLDDQWLVREVSLFPTPDSVYRLGTEPDGSVLIQELTASSLADVLANVVGTLPSLLNPDAVPQLRSVQAR
ncbi:MAG: hypothetical protein ACAI38_04445 [Myxococcota bacterium]|nr:hypothetical protein [Myxococcota bacterium]